MSEPRDRVDDGFQALRFATLAALVPPGVQQVQQTVRRRRVVRVSLCAVVLVALIPPILRGSGGMAPEPLASQTAPSSASASPSSEPSTPVVDASPAPLGSGSAAGRPAPAASEPPTEFLICDAELSVSGYTVSIIPNPSWNDPRCLGDEGVHFMLLTYSPWADGRSERFRDTHYSLTHDEPSTTYAPYADNDGMCAYSSYLLDGEEMPQTLPATVVDHASAKAFWASLNMKLLVSSFVDTCPTAEPTASQ